MRITIYIACLLFAILTIPFVAVANGMVNGTSMWIGDLVGFQSPDLVLTLARLIVTTIMLAGIYAIVGMLAGELNLLMALLAGIVPVYNAAGRFLGNLTGSRLSLNEMFYSHSTRDIPILGGFGDLLVVATSLLVAWLLVRKLLTIAGIRSFSV